MTLMIIDKLSASLTIPLTFGLVIIYVLRKIGTKYPKDHMINVMNKGLRRFHIPMGIGLAIVSIIHGFASQTPVFWGIVCTVIIILLGLNFAMRKRLRRPNWIKIHRYLTLLMLVTLFLHLNEIKSLKIKDFEQFDSGIYPVEQTLTSQDVNN